MGRSASARAILYQQPEQVTKFTVSSGKVSTSEHHRAEGVSTSSACASAFLRRISTTSGRVVMAYDVSSPSSVVKL